MPCTAAAGTGPARARLADYAGNWLLLLFYPRDFSFICPLELRAFSARIREFSRRGCVPLAVSVDDVKLHEEWLKASPADGGVGPLSFPLASDLNGKVARAYGVYLPDKKVACRGLFLIDPEGAVQYAVVQHLRVGRSPDDVLRMLDALRIGGLCRSSWTLADGTIDPARSLGPGRIIGHYRIQDKLGQGGFGEVFRAWDLWLRREIALKVLKPGKKANLHRTLAEARSAAGLNHPNICTVYSVEEEEGLPLITMEYLPGKSLTSVLRSGPLTLEDSLIVARALGDAMAASHGRGIVHGDLKPGNIIITNDGVPKILDFGIAHRNSASLATPPPSNAATHDGKPSPLVSKTGSPAKPPARRPTDRADETTKNQNLVKIRGTPAFLSPEQSYGAPASTASDVFSFGLVFYQMLTGERAVPNRSRRGALSTVRHSDLSVLAQQAPEPFRPLLKKTLQRNPDERPTMSQIVESLDVLYTQLPADVSDDGIDTD